MPAVKVLHNAFFPQSCGLGEIGVFRFEGGIVDTKTVQPKGGCDWVLASFTEQRPEYKQAYKELCERWKLLYKSEVRKNKRTGRDFFFCIFDTRNKP